MTTGRPGANRPLFGCWKGQGDPAAVFFLSECCLQVQLSVPRRLPARRPGVPALVAGSRARGLGGLVPRARARGGLSLPKQRFVFAVLLLP